MFDVEQRLIENQITTYLELHHLPEMEFKWSWIPFNGEWGMSLSFFQLAAKSFGQKKGNVGQKAKEISEGLAAYLKLLEGIKKIQAVNGYLNLYFTTAIYSTKIVDTILEKKDRLS